MKLLSRVYTVCTSILLLLAVCTNRSMACGPMLDEEQRISLFRQRLLHNDGLAAFYYTEHYLTYAVQANDYATNCAEWASYTQNKVSVGDIDTMLYHISGKDFVQMYLCGKWGTYKRNEFLKWLLLPKNKAAMEYMVLAKEVERTYYDELNAENDWAYNLQNKQLAGGNTLLRKAKNGATKRLPTFLKTRYAFQAVKMMYYDLYYSTDTVICDADGGTRDHRQLINYYKQHLEGRKSIVVEWGRLYYGLSMTDRMERAQQLILCFDNCTEKRAFIYNYLSSSDVAALSKRIKEPSMLAAIQTYIGIKNSGEGLEQLEQVYALAPKSDYAALLLVRELAKLDNWLLASELTGFEPVASPHKSVWETKWEDEQNNVWKPKEWYVQMNRKKDLAYLKKVTKVVASIADKERDNALWQLALVHLHHLDRNYKAAAAVLQELPPQKNEVYEQQRLTELLLNCMYSKDVNSKATQDKIAKLMGKLEQMEYKAPTSENAVTIDRYVPAELYLMLSKLYYKQGNVVYAGLMERKSGITVDDYRGGWVEETQIFNYNKIAYLDRMGRPKDVDAYLQLARKKNKTALEQLIATNIGAEEWYKELKGTMLLREGKYAAAYEVYKELPADYWVNNYEYKDYLKTLCVSAAGTLLPEKDKHDYNYTMPSKRLIAKELMQLERNTQMVYEHGELAYNYYRLGNGLMNITYVGRDWMASSYGKSGSESGDEDGWRSWAFYNFRTVNKKAWDNYYHATAAKRAYKKALTLAKGRPELEAKILLMLAYLDNTTNYEQAYDKQPANDYLNWLQKNYSKTKVYELAITTCPDVAAMEGVTFDYSKRR